MFLDAGPSTVVILRERGVGKGSGAPFEQVHPQLWTFREERIIRWESFAKRTDALEAAGLSECSLSRALKAATRPQARDSRPAP